MKNTNSNRTSRWRGALAVSLLLASYAVFAQAPPAVSSMSTQSEHGTASDTSWVGVGRVLDEHEMGQIHGQWHDNMNNARFFWGVLRSVIDYRINSAMGPYWFRVYAVVYRLAYGSTGPSVGKGVFAYFKIHDVNADTLSCTMAYVANTAWYKYWRPGLASRNQVCTTVNSCLYASSQIVNWCRTNWEHCKANC